LTYESVFTVTEESSRFMLKLGKVAHSAEVWLNDQPVGSRLWSPFDFDITSFITKGDNKIKVVVGNLLCNPKPSECGGFIQWKEKAEDFDAGIIGPVRVVRM